MKIAGQGVTLGRSHIEQRNMRLSGGDLSESLASAGKCANNRQSLGTPKNIDQTFAVQPNSDDNEHASDAMSRMLGHVARLGQATALSLTCSFRRMRPSTDYRAATNTVRRREF